MKYGSLALILLVSASLSLVVQIQSLSTERANDERTSAIHVLKGDIGTGATSFTALILNRFSWAKELLRELLLHYGIALKAVPQRPRPTQMSSACKGFPTS